MFSTSSQMTHYQHLGIVKSEPVEKFSRVTCELDSVFIGGILLEHYI